MFEPSKISGSAAVFHPDLPQRLNGVSALSAEHALEEACRLTEAIRLRVVAQDVIRVPRPKPATLFGSGAVDEMRAQINSSEADVVIVDGVLSPVQQRNLEKALNAKVIDRTGLILEIFGERARTKEGQLQVELAHLTYQRSRLVRSWTHLERQRGGMGFLGGPGETQIEIDRRLIGERITSIKKELETVSRTRGLHRESRKKVPFPVVALVGYTNAGKSTLFNALTKAKVMAKDMLFATLDPTMRKLDLPSGRSVILSDTVGFVSALPHELVAAFRATLEEVTEADVVLHVRDAAHPETDAQKTDVEQVLGDLNVTADSGKPFLEVMNKADLMPLEVHSRMAAISERHDDMVLVSALKQEGFDALLELIDTALDQTRETVTVTVPLDNGELMAWLYRSGEVLERRDEGLESSMTVRLDPEDAARLATRLSG